MEIVENSLGIELDAFLEQPLFCFLGTLSSEGHPRVSPLWFLWEDECIWIIADAIGKSYTKRVEQHPETAIAIVDFAVHSGLVYHVGMRGTAEIVSLDEGRVYRLLRRYLGSEMNEWDSRFSDLDSERWSLIRFEPATVVMRDQSISPTLSD